MSVFRDVNGEAGTHALRPALRIREFARGADRLQNTDRCGVIDDSKVLLIQSEPLTEPVKSHLLEFGRGG